MDPASLTNILLTAITALLVFIAGAADHIARRLDQIAKNGEHSDSWTKD